DPDDSPANNFFAVEITTLPMDGTFELNNVSVMEGDFIPVADISDLVYTPFANGNGTTWAEFTFQVQDDGGTDNGGVDLDPTPRTLTIDVSSVNDAPVGADNTVGSNEDNDYTFGPDDFMFDEDSDAPPNAL